VVAPEVPLLAGATKVPEPVNLIVRRVGEFRADANATPPASMVKGAKLVTLMMSQRTWSLVADALEFGKVPVVGEVVVVETESPLSHAKARLARTTPMRRAPNVRVFIVPPLERASA